jgi:hypothetical protein
MGTTPTHPPRDAIGDIPQADPENRNFAAVVATEMHGTYLDEETLHAFVGGKKCSQTDSLSVRDAGTTDFPRSFPAISRHHSGAESKSFSELIKTLSRFVWTSSGEIKTFSKSIEANLEEFEAVVVGLKISIMRIKVFDLLSY